MPKTTKAESISNFLASNPEATDEQIVEGLAATGIDVTLQYVKQVKAKLNKPAEPDERQPPTEKKTCRKCGSSKVKYSHERELKYKGSHDGRPFEKIVWRRGQCECGQWRVDKFYC